jgi:hypothetical protein
LDLGAHLAQRGEDRDDGGNHAAKDRLISWRCGGEQVTAG